jgi:hypothetical protein
VSGGADADADALLLDCLLMCGQSDARPGAHVAHGYEGSLMACAKHKDYQAKRQPTGKCPACWKMWWDAVSERIGKGKPVKKAKGK